MDKFVCFYFQVHQPDRLRQFRFFDIGNDDHYFDEFANRTILRRVAERCYLPANSMLLDMIRKWKGQFKVAFSISGVAIEQFEMYAPEVLESFKTLAGTGCVEFLAETYSHTLASLVSPEEFKSQVELHASTIEKYFGRRPVTFRNTELLYSDEIGSMVADMGFGTMLTEGAKHILGWKSPGFVYTNAINPRLKLLLRNFELSDDIAFRFSDRGWGEWPLTAEKFTQWLSNALVEDEIVNLFMDYETLGEHQAASSGVFDFLYSLPQFVFEAGIKFCTPSEASASVQPVAPLHVVHPISWADEERDTSAWLGNELQDEAFKKTYALEPMVTACGDEKLSAIYRKIQESDHYYYMCTKFFSDGAVHSYFNPYDTPYEAFINYMNVLSDFELHLKEALLKSEEKEKVNRKKKKK